MPKLRHVRRLLTVPVGDIMDLVAAQIGLLAAVWIVRRRRRGELLHRHGAGAFALAPPKEQEIERMATAFDRAARCGVFRPTCLVRAIALERYLQHTGTHAAVRIGVRRDRDRLLAHAWIEMGDRVIGDEPAFVRRFVPLQDFSALPR